MMLRSPRCLVAVLTLLAALVFGAGLALAQEPGALPTAPGADRALTPGIPSTAALASLPGGNGSPLEPYLFVAMFVGGGALALLAVTLSSRYMLSDSDAFERIIIK